MVNALNKDTVLAAASEVKEPSLDKSLLNASLVRDVEVKDGQVELTLALIAPQHPQADQIKKELERQDHQIRWR